MISEYDAIRLRINNYLSIIQICLLGFNKDTVFSLAENDRGYLEKISQGFFQLTSLLNELDFLILDNKITSTRLDKFRHDIRLAINIIQGYSELIIENFPEKHTNLMGGNFIIIIHAIHEILKNTDCLKEDS